MFWRKLPFQTWISSGRSVFSTKTSFMPSTAMTPDPFCLFHLAILPRGRMAAVGATGVGSKSKGPCGAHVPDCGGAGDAAVGALLCFAFVLHVYICELYSTA